MIDFYGSHFEYGGISSRKYGLIFAVVSANRYLRTSGTVKGVTAFNKRNCKRYLIDDDYSDAPLSFEVEFVADYDGCIELSEQREIRKWLFNRHEYKKLYIDMADDIYGETFEIIDGKQKQLYLNCRFINAEEIEGNGGVAGYKATLEADSGFWWQDSITKEYEIDNQDSTSTSTIVVSVDTDIDDYTYPKVTITMAEDFSAEEESEENESEENESEGNESEENESEETVENETTLEDVVIWNASDDEYRLTKFEGLAEGSTVIMRGDINYVSGDFYEKFTGQNFPRLIDGDNSIVVMGKVASIKIEFNNRRMM